MGAYTDTTVGASGMRKRSILCLSAEEEQSSSLNNQLTTVYPAAKSVSDYFFYNPFATFFNQSNSKSIMLSIDKLLVLHKGTIP